MAGGRHTRGSRPGTPRGELDRFQEGREKEAEETHRKILAAILETAGERGYRRVAVQDVIDRYGGNRVQFYRHFSSKADCYAAAYEDQADRLAARLLEAAEGQGCWRLALRAGLEELARFAEENPLLARGLLIEVHVVGGPSLRRRAEIHESLARGLDSVRNELGSNASPPAITAQFMVGAVESTVAGALAVGEPEAFSAAVPELAHMIVSAYLGEDAAGEELAAAKAA